MNSNRENFPCPYCFEKISHKAVHFLSASVAKEKAKSDAELEGAFSDDVELEKAIQHNELIKLFAARDEDAKLRQFWVNEDRGGEPAYTEFKGWGDPKYYRWNNPVITPENAAQTTQNGYEEDEDGFVHCVRDALNGRESRVRLCPHCHNPLPADYGRYPITIITIVGITSSGKTVYLSQLIPKIEIYLTQVGCGAFGVKDFHATGLSEIAYDKVLPAGTTKNVMRRPMCTTFRSKSGEFGQIIMYDIAGENCTDPADMLLYGRYIENADGIIMLLDPAQFPTLNTKKSKATGDAEKAGAVLQAIFTAFLQTKLDGAGRATLPVALTISKSDYLHGVVNEGSNIFKAIEHEEEKGGFAQKQYTNLRGEVAQLLRTHDEALYELARKLFCEENLGYCAVSALGCDSKWVLYSDTPGMPQFPMNDANAELINSYLSEPGGSNGMTFAIKRNPASLSDQVVYMNVEEDLPEKPDSASEDVYFCVDGSRLCLLTRRSDYEVVKKQQRDAENNGGDDASYRVLVYYQLGSMPEEQPHPTRIEEPFQWLLMCNGLIEPAQVRGQESNKKMGKSIRTTEVKGTGNEKKGFWASLFGKD